MTKFNGIDRASFVRIGLLLVALVNQALVAAGYNTLPFAEADVEVLLSTGFTIVTASIAAYKDNRKNSADKPAKPKN